MHTPSPQFIKALAEVIEQLFIGGEWLNHSVSTDHDESIHLVMKNEEVTRFDLRIGSKRISIVPPTARPA